MIDHKTYMIHELFILIEDIKKYIQSDVCTIYEIPIDSKHEWVYNSDMKTEGLKFTWTEDENHETND